MKWPLKSKAVSHQETPFYNLLYLSADQSGGPDSTIVWTSEIEWRPIQDFVQHFNQQNSRLIGSSHLLVQAVGRALSRHPEINRRVVGGRVYSYRHCNVCLASRVPHNNEVKVIQIKQADQKSLYQIGYIVWKKQIEFMRGASAECRDLRRMRMLPTWMLRSMIRAWNFLDSRMRLPIWGRIDQVRESVVLVNDFSHPRFPMMRGYKPSRQPGGSKPLNVTLGRPEDKVTLIAGQPVVKQIAPLTIRVDHRICDGYALGQFMATVIRQLSEPAKMQADTEQSAGLETLPMHRQSA